MTNFKPYTRILNSLLVLDKSKHSKLFALSINILSSMSLFLCNDLFDNDAVELEEEYSGAF